MEVMWSFLGSVVIPAKGRLDLVERAIDSVLAQDGSESVEIILVDDGSEPRLAPRNLRSFDRTIRLDDSKGAAVCRNIGIAASQGKVIYLLDSDDLFLLRDFKKVAESAASGVVYYSDIDSQGYESDFPSRVSLGDYFDYIFLRYRFIGQTSSLCFLNEQKFHFDEALPKHQDWDFAYCQVLLRGFEFKKMDGRIFFDRSDQSSLSRAQNPAKSKPWILKLDALKVLSDKDLAYVKFNLLARTKACSLVESVFSGLNYMVSGRLKVDEFARIVYRRVFS